MSSSLASTGTTHAWVVSSRGPYSSHSVLKYVPDHPLSALRPGQVRVRMKFASAYKGSTYFWHLIPTFVRKHVFSTPHEVADFEGAGVVEEVYEEEGKESKFKVGDEVFGAMDPPGKISKGRGVMALHATYLEGELSHKPKNLTWEEAAGANGMAQTAYFCMIEVGKLRAGQRIFLNGGSTSVGLVGIQIAKAVGAYVVTSCSAKNFDLVKQMGADEIFDYTAQPLHEQLTAKFSGANSFDLIFDAAGTRSLFLHSPSYLIPSGRFLAVGGDLHSYSVSRFILDIFLNTWQPTWLGGTPRKFTFLNTFFNLERTQKLIELIDKGMLHVPVDSVWPLQDVRQAYERVLSGRARGKVVVRIDAGDMQ